MADTLQKTSRPVEPAMADKKTPARAAKRAPIRKTAAKALKLAQAPTLVARGKRALDGAYQWAGDASVSIPRAARNLQMPDANALRAMATGNPLILGAVGIGLGVIIGAMLSPSRPTDAVQRRSKPRRG